MTVSAAALPDTAMPRAVRIWRWRVFASTWLCYAGFYFCRKPFSIAKSRIGLDLHLDTERLAWIGAAYLIAYWALAVLFSPAGAVLALAFLATCWFWL